MPANIDKALEQGLRLQQDKDDRDNSVLHVSDLAHTIPGEGCPRQLWLRLHGYKRHKLTAGKLLMFDHGKQIHKRLVEITKPILEQRGEWGYLEVEYPMAFDGVIGTCDCILLHHATDNTIVQDFKSQRGNAFREDRLALLPKPGHVIQVQGYIYGLKDDPLFQNLRVKEPSAGALLYVDREGQNAAIEKPVERNDARVREAIMELKDIAANSMPPILEPIIKEQKKTKTKGIPLKARMPWVCDYCDYLDISCDGALRKEHRLSGIVGHRVDDKFIPKDGIPAGIYATVSELIEGTYIPF